MRMVVVLALAALVALIVALITGSAWPAVAVILLAGGGLVLLLRDWRAERGLAGDGEGAAPRAALNADELSPDIAADPPGGSVDTPGDR